MTMEEFRSQLRVFTEFEYSVTELDESSQLLALTGKADYTIGHSCGRDIFDKEPPKEVHLVAAEAKREGLDENYWQCVAQVTALHKSRKVAGKANCKVWGILSNATVWRLFSLTMRASFTPRKISCSPWSNTTMLKCMQYIGVSIILSSPALMLLLHLRR